MPFLLRRTPSNPWREGLHDVFSPRLPSKESSMKRGYGSGKRIVTPSQVTQPPNGPPPGSPTLEPQIVELGALRGLNPDDCVVVTVKGNITEEVAHNIKRRFHATLGCKVLILGDGMTIAREDACSTTSPQHPPTIRANAVESLIVHPSHAESMDGSSPL